MSWTKWWRWGFDTRAVILLIIHLLPTSRAEIPEQRLVCSCPYTAWSEWSKCDCPSGVSIRSKSCIDYSHDLGCNMLQQTPCPCPTSPIESDTENQANQMPAAADDLIVPANDISEPPLNEGECTCCDWAEWAPCDCDLHNRKRWRHCTETGAGVCAARGMHRMQTVNCECSNQTLSCACSEWADWSNCACSDNVQSRTRICDSPRRTLDRAKREPASDHLQFKLVSSSRYSDMDYCVAKNPNMSLGLGLCGDVETTRWSWDGTHIKSTSGCITATFALGSNTPTVTISQCDSLDSAQIWKLTDGRLVTIDHAPLNGGKLPDMARKSQFCLAVPHFLQRRHPGKHYFEYTDGEMDTLPTGKDQEFTLTLEECDSRNDRQWWVFPESTQGGIQSDEGIAPADGHATEFTCDASQALTKDVQECVCARNGSIFNPDPQVIDSSVIGGESNSPNMAKLVVGGVFGSLGAIALLVALGLVVLQQVRRKRMKEVQDGNVYRPDRGAHDLFHDPVIEDLERNYVEPDYELFGSGDFGPAISV
eukprot:comp19051_c0_seq1/m.21490 comp19051_c0_seq1/g.21490  ORF comp19051_c0_seq1/g.21490 comp19051_c0_seq1/m.21490 type:complete len:536 (-) comp19051_c0_seq1:401-2008(-)